MTSNYPRIVLWLALAVALWLNYQAWVRDYPPLSSTVSDNGSSAHGAGARAPSLGFNVPQASSNAAAGSSASAGVRGAAPPGTSAESTGAGRASAQSATTQSAGAAQAASAAPGTQETNGVVPLGPAVHVRTDVLDDAKEVLARARRFAVRGPRVGSQVASGAPTPGVGASQIESTIPCTARYPHASASRTSSPKSWRA